MNLQECCSFKKMITPVIIQVLFWIGVVITTVSGLIGIIGGLASHSGGGGGMVLTGLIVLLVGPIVIRVQCELIIVIFRILDVLVDIRDRQCGAGSSTTTTPPTPPTGM